MNYYRNAEPSTEEAERRWVDLDRDASRDAIADWVPLAASAVILAAVVCGLLVKAGVL